MGVRREWFWWVVKGGGANVKEVKLYQCEVCGNEYSVEAFARECESSMPPCLFVVGDKVFIFGEPGSSFSPGGRSVEIDKLELRPLLHKDTARRLIEREEQNKIGHYWVARLRACDEYGFTYVKDLYWLQKDEGVS